MTSKIFWLEESDLMSRHDEGRGHTLSGAVGRRRIRGLAAGAHVAVVEVWPPRRHFAFLPGGVRPRRISGFTALVPFHVFYLNRYLYPPLRTHSAWYVPSIAIPNSFNTLGNLSVTTSPCLNWISNI